MAALGENGDLENHRVVTPGLAAIDLQTGTAGGLFYGYASVVDNLSGDPIFVPPR